MRRSQAKVRKVTPDAVYGHPMITRLIGRALMDGKKSVAEREVYNALKIVKEKTNADPVEIFNKALENIRPTMEVRARRIGGAAYQVPMNVRGRRQDSLAIRWLVEQSRARSNSEYHTYGEKLAAELIDASNGSGLSVKKRQDVEHAAEANRAFAHFRW